MQIALNRKRRLHSPPLRKLLRIMKLTFILLTAVALQVSAKGYTQKITLSVKDAPLEKVFESIRNQSGYRFFYNEEQLQRSRPVTIQVKETSLEKALDLALRDQPFTYAIVNKIIVIKEKLNDIAIQTQLKSAPLVIDVKGRVINEKGEPAEGVTVTIKGTNKATSTNADGEFIIESIEEDATLVFTSVNMETFELKVSGKTELTINLKTKVTALGGVKVEVNTGYQKIPKERATGSFELVNKEELNRRVGPDILSRLEGVSVSVLFDRRGLSPIDNSISSNNIFIRGLSTLTETMKAPLLIVNNFPWEGSIESINPNDVENITILKDAAAASIWGARAANGVIVITTKQGQLNQPTRLMLNTNFQVSKEPDLFHYPKMSSSDFIEVEQFLFEQGHYDAEVNDPSYFPALSPIVEILAKERAGDISPTDAVTQIDALRNLDVRNDFQKYIYRKASNQQYFLNLTGGSQKIRYSFSGGFDKGNSALIGNETQRVTFRNMNTIYPVKNLELNFGLAFASTKTKGNSLGEINGGKFDYFGSTIRYLYPYAQFADASGNPLDLPRHYRYGFKDTAGSGKLLDWKYRPLDELRNGDNLFRQREYVLNFGANYNLFKSISASIAYQHSNTYGELRNHYSIKTYQARHLINQYAQFDGTDFVFTIPKGGILDYGNNKGNSHMGRAQLNFNKSINQRHQINGLIGGEVRENVVESTAGRSYGYDENTIATFPVDYITQFSLYNNLGSATIPAGPIPFSKRVDHFLSAFANFAYTYDNRYTVSASIRRDAANLFGVDINDKWKPFWSVGGAWTLSNESFLKGSRIDLLRIRANYGYQGNVNNSLAPYTIISYASPFFSPFNLLSVNILVPANPGLSWETIKQLNIGVDFQFANRRISGSIEAYRKNSNNLILDAPVDYTTGVGSVRKNSASMTGSGVDFLLNTANITGSFKWNTEVTLGYIKNKVTDYLLDDTYTRVGTAVSGSGISIRPVRGIAPYALFSYEFAGLDPVTGDPRGFLGKEISTDYRAIYNQDKDTSALIYHGSAIPTMFGNFNNIFSYKGISLIVNISYRFGYYFRKNTISYSALFNNGLAHPDFAKRWQNPGDETATTVPSMVYPLSDAERDYFYAHSSVNVLKADNIRFKNIRIGYDIPKSFLNRLSIQGLQFYSTIENLGIIWRANKEDLDPDYNTGNGNYPVPLRVSFGLTLNL